MRTCPRKFAFSYVERARPSFVPATLRFGGSIHAALELRYRCRLEGLTATPEALLSAYHDAWRREHQRDGDIPVRFNKGDDTDTLAALADRMLRSFLDSPLATPKGTILGVEEELRVELVPDLPDLLARVDLVTMTDESLFVIDFKTSRSRWTEPKAQESGDQLVLYGRTVEELGRTLGLPVKLHFAIITKAKKPVIQLLPVPTDPTRVAALTESVSQVWRAIQTGNFYPSPSPQNCTSCPFRSRCPVFAG
ncbi:RecB family exonuclease [Humisphaera borealis]|uniref:PD-(D/E)XK nuclease family protein n=1 Tax=Humisphaera borealis TaxID=2807512 RepID=A0A7M2WZ53_9BACT|nr:PD-(D/E)XK nuclease family protein [Humisphaera borealis]QOV89760.1 PD-(D/E)XK nuclease family protein [Humisphaera borealis]